MTPVQSDGTFNINFSNEMVLDADTLNGVINILMFTDEDPDSPITVEWEIVNISSN